MPDQKRNSSERLILVIMRMFAVGGLLAIPPVFFPYDWMNSIHEFMGMGPLPNTPIVSYLARCLSAFYAGFGTLALYISLDIRTNRRFVKLWAAILTSLGITILGIDLVSEMPWHWTLSEGPFSIIAGTIVLSKQPKILSAKIDSAVE